MRNDPSVLGKLPVHPDNRRKAGVYVLQVDGLVGQTLALTPSDFQQFPEQDVTENFACEEGWIVPAVKWGGVTLESVLAFAKVHPEAQWVQASAGEFTVPIPLQEARGALLATHLGEDALPSEHGGPVRLVTTPIREDA
jgi:DMSO/TMAO reductase YedYZ molybdopterin-dependent catalytic subunit